MPKVKIDENLLLKVAKNARLQLSENEMKKFLSQMQEILEAFSKIDELETENTKPSFQPLELKNIYRNDEVKKSFSQEEALSLSKHKKNNYFKGPKVVLE